MAILFGNGFSVTMKNFVQVVDFLENGKIKLVHGMKVYPNLFEKVTSMSNLLAAWEKFKAGKVSKKDVRSFEYKLEENLFALHDDLVSGHYRHGAYAPFYIQDPKQRLIHKATVRDRVLHHALFNILSPLFDPTFITNSFSCRVGKGIHKGVASLKNGLRKVSRNNTRTCFALKCDVQKFFQGVDQETLMAILARKIRDNKALKLLEQVISSHELMGESKEFCRGIPIGNLTSQLFANIYMNELDQFVKHRLRAKYYYRYTDDFIMISTSREKLVGWKKQVNLFLLEKLKLKLHPRKVTIRKYSQGIDFLGYVLFPHHQIVRIKTKRRMLKKLRRKVEGYERGTTEKNSLLTSMDSYLGVLKHANSFKVKKEIRGLMRTVAERLVES